MIRLGASIVLVLVLAACGGPVPSPASGPSPLGGTWTAVVVGNRTAVVGQEPRIQFTEGGRIQGTTGCNEFGGQYRSNGDRIAIGQLVQTEIGCGGEVAAVEATFTELLGAAERMEAGEGTLVLAGPPGEIRFVQRAPAAGGRELLEVLRSTAWRIVGGTGLRAPGAIGQVTFDDDAIMAIGRCGFNGRVDLVGDGRIEFAQIGYDAMSCGSAEADAARNVVVRLLEATETIELTDDGAIVLGGPAGELRLEPAA